jgi:hypothetical protein
MPNKKPNTVINLFCGGTDYRETAKFELISEMYHATEGEKYFLPGPGCNSSVRRDLPYQPGAWSQLRDRMFGRGMDRNIGTYSDLLIERLKNLPPDRTDKIEVNLAGWSRGAVTCMGLAYNIQKFIDENPQYKNRIEFNMFLVDPVPGIGKNKERLTTIPQCAKKVTVIYAQDESRLHVARTANFKIDPISDPSIEIDDREINIIRVPGEHYGGVCSLWTSNPYVAIYTTGLACETMEKFGTRIDRDKIKVIHRDKEEVTVQSFNKYCPNDNYQKLVQGVMSADLLKDRGHVYFSKEAEKRPVIHSKNLKIYSEAPNGCINVNSNNPIKLSIARQLDLVIMKPFHIKNLPKGTEKEALDRLQLAGQLRHLCNYYLNPMFILTRNNRDTFIQMRKELDTIIPHVINKSEDEMCLYFQSFMERANKQLNNSNSNKDGLGNNTIAFMNKLITQFAQPQIVDESHLDNDNRQTL